MRYPPGTRVRIVGGPEGVVVEVDPSVEPPSYRVFVNSLSTPLVSENDLESVEVVESDLGALLRGKAFAALEEFRFALTLRKLADQLTDTLYSYNAARIQIQPHQFKPLLKLLESPYRRLLIADEVGLGKTIEAGIILNEFNLREGLERVLVVCPHALVHKWRDELDAKFGTRFDLLGAGRLRQWLVDAINSGVAQPIRGIVSLEAIRAQAMLDLIEALPTLIDLLIVDEAHHLRNNEAQSFAIGEALAAASDIVLFLSATPLNLRSRDLYNLVHLLLPDVYANPDTFEAQIIPNRALNHGIRLLRAGGSSAGIRAALAPLGASEMASVFEQSERFSAMVERLEEPEALTREERVGYQRLCTDLNTLDGVLTRTRKADVAPFAVREPHAVTLRFCASERSFYDAVTAFCLERYAETGGIGFGAVTYQRQVCSCISAMYELLQGVAAREAVNADEEYEYDDDLDEGNEPDANEDERRPLSPAERALLEQALGAAVDVGDTDTKYRYFEALIDDLISANSVQRVLVFSFFRRTIRYLERRLKTKYRVGVVMGGMSLEERGTILERFQRGEIQILLSTEVGGEGLDFQFCNALVNYDLPWNPMRVEQRIGRLDRFGQTHDKILIYNLLVEDTVEARIFGRLFERIELFKATIGDLEAILGDVVSDLTKVAMNLTLSAEQQADKAEQLALQLIQRKKDEEALVNGRDNLLSNDQYLLDRFGAIERGRSYITAEELANFCREAVAREFPHSYLTRNTGRWSFRPDPRFLEYVRREIYGLGADGRLHNAGIAISPLARLQGAAHDKGAIPVTFEADEAFDNRGLELLAPQHPFVQALVRCCETRPKNRLSVTKLSIPTGHTLAVGEYVLALFKLESTGLRPVRRLEAIVAPISGGNAVRMEPEWFGRVLELAMDSRGAQPSASRMALDEAVAAAKQCMVDLLESERQNLERRQRDLVRLRVASLEHAYEHKRRVLERAIATVGNDAIRRMREGELKNVTERHNEQVAKLQSQAKAGITYDHVAAVLLDVA